MDVDMLICNNFISILNHASLSWRPVATYKIKEKYPELVKDNIYIEAPNGGLILFKKELLRHGLNTNILYNELDRFNKKYNRVNDEVVLASIAMNNNISVDYLDIRYNAWPSHKDADKAYIIHAAGQDKFWNNKLFGTVYNEWYVNHKIWLKTIGQKFTSSTYTCRELKEIFDVKNTVEKTIEASMAHLKTDIRNMDTEIKEVKKAVFPFKRLTRHLRKLWQVLFRR